MNKIMKRVGAVCISILMLFTLCMPCFADETQKTIRVGSFEDTFNYVDDHGVRRGYGYELMQALAGYTGWKFEYVKCVWSNCFDKLENGEIDIMGDISYTDDRAKEMLFSEETMGEEKYVLYANLSDMDIVPSDFKSLDGKRIGVLKGAKPEYMLTEWENKYGIHTEHVNVSGNEDVKKKLENNEIDCFVSLEESIWSERGISSVTTIGKSDIYFAINKERSDIKQELDYAMRQLDSDSPFYKADLYKKYFTLDYTQFLTGNEKSWLEEHGGIRIGFLNNDPIVFSMDKKSGEIRGTLSEYISYAKDCLGNHTLKFDIQAFDDYDKMIEALQNKEIDVIYYASRNSNVAEKKGYALSNTAWTYSLMAVTEKEDFNENDSYVVAVPKNKVALKQHIAYYYPQWKLVDCDSIEDGANMVVDGKADCFIKGSSQVLKFDGNKNFKIISLTKTMEACFGIKDGQAMDNGMDGLHQISEDTDLVILDIMMPGISGIKTCEQIRKVSYVPILFLTAKSSENDKIIGFTAGADDYLVKPFSYAELLARIKALLRRKQVYTCGNMKENGQNVWIKKGDLKINTTGNKVFSGDEEIYLTETEYEILSLMLKYRGKIFSVQNIYESVWQEPFFNNSANTVMVHIRKLRLKIEKNPQKPQIIQTVWGKGYRIE